jgi:hypothetical protein
VRTGGAVVGGWNQGQVVFGVADLALLKCNSHR